MGTLIVMGIGSVVWLAFGRTKPTTRSELARTMTTRRATGSEAGSVTAGTTATPALRGQTASGTPPADASSADLPAVEMPPEQVDAMGAAWANVNMDEVRTALPDNLYWKLSAPTKDPAVLEERDAERDRWNVEYGKVLSGSGTEEEIRNYYDLRARISGDYIEFASYLLDHYGDTLSERDTNLLKLAIRLHRARLEEIPRKVEDALERKRQQDAARQAWLADQAVFGNANPDSGPADDSNSD